jgi:hypothetical protein
MLKPRLWRPGDRVARCPGKGGQLNDDWYALISLKEAAALANIPLRELKSYAEVVDDAGQPFLGTMRIGGRLFTNRDRLFSADPGRPGLLEKLMTRSRPAGRAA